MELEKMRNLNDEELAHQGRTSAEQLFRLRFQVSMGQNDGVKKLRELRREIAQIKTIARERELGIHGEAKAAKTAAPAAEGAQAEAAVPAAEKKAVKAKAAAVKTRAKAMPKAKAKPMGKTKTKPAAKPKAKAAKAKGAGK